MTQDEKPIEGNQSSVARLMAEIGLQYQAAQLALTGAVLGASKHEFITARTERIEIIREQLTELVGPDEATRMVVEEMNKASDNVKETK
ncbi:MAG TPA: hypothetical protein VGL94_03685 [Ktedonobacteraceae bacterium]|jgi:hypothetical protein